MTPVLEIFSHFLKNCKHACLDVIVLQVVIEAPGWNDALYFAGLGVDGEYVNPNVPDSGEKAVVRNLVLRTPNPEQTFVAHVVRGQATITNCLIEGTPALAF